MAEGLKDKTTQFISKLVQLTRDGKLEWEASFVTPEDSVSTAYEATIDETRLRIYRAKRRVDTGFTSAVAFTTGVVLEVLDEMQRSLYSFEDKAGINDLYESAAYSAAKIDDLVNSVLKMR